METSVIIANWNGKHLLKDCLPSLKRMPYRDFMTIVVDNASTDGSVEYMKENFPWVKVVRMDRNYGFTRSNNAGIREAFKDKGMKYAAILNNDTVVDSNWLKRLVDTAKSGPEIGMCATKIIYVSRKDTINTDGILIYRDGHAKSLHIGEKASKFRKNIEIFGPTAVAALYTREALEKVGLFDDHFFMYQEEVDLAWRIRYAGYKCIFVHDAVIYHVHSASSKRFSPFKAYHSERNRIWLVFKNFTLPMMAGSAWYTAVRYYYLIKGLREKKGAAAEFAKREPVSKAMLVFLKAWLVGLIMLPLFIPKRIRIQHMRRKNRIGNKKIAGWFRRFGVDAESMTRAD